MEGGVTSDACIDVVGGSLALRRIRKGVLAMDAVTMQRKL